MASGEIAGSTSSPGAVVTWVTRPVRSGGDPLPGQKITATASTAIGTPTPTNALTDDLGIRSPGTGRVSVGVTPPLGVASASKCGIISLVVCHRSAGRFSKHFMTNCSNGRETAGLCFETGSGWAVTCAERII